MWKGEGGGSVSQEVVVQWDMSFGEFFYLESRLDYILEGSFTSVKTRQLYSPHWLTLLVFHPQCVLRYSPGQFSRLDTEFGIGILQIWIFYFLLL